MGLKLKAIFLTQAHYNDRYSSLSLIRVILLFEESLKSSSMAAFASSTASGLASTIFYSPSLNPLTCQATLFSPIRIRSSPRVFRGLHRRFSQNVTTDRFKSFSCNCLSAVSTSTIDYEVMIFCLSWFVWNPHFKWCLNQSGKKIW